MDVCIHRGSRQIGGTCIEVESQGVRILLDLGTPLDAEVPDPQDLPKARGLASRDDSLLGLFISHPHQDHYGLARHADPSVPVFIGEKANRILRAASRYVPNGYAFENPRSWCTGNH